MLVKEIFTVAEIEEIVKALHVRMHKCAQKLHAYKDAVVPMNSQEIPYAYCYKDICYFSNYAFDAMFSAMTALVSGGELNKIQWLQVVKAVRKTESKKLFDKVTERLFCAEECMPKPLETDWAQLIMDGDILP